MSERKINFFPGPCTLPYPVLEESLRDSLSYKDTGMSLWELSHRTPEWEEVHFEALRLMREIFRIPDTHHIVMLGAGGTLQFTMIPMAFLGQGKFAQYVKTGYWATTAINDASKVGDVRVVASSEDKNYMYVPKGYEVDQKAEYLYTVTNNTIYGSELHALPETGNVPIIADMSSDILTRPVDWSRIGLAFAGLTKNLGPGGMAVVIIRNDMLEKANRNLPSYLRYDLHVQHNSMLNTPPTFCIYLMKGILEWTRDNGGLDQMDKNADERARIVYDVIDANPSYYNCPVVKEDRSRTNIVFHLPTEDLEKKFVAEAVKNDMIGLAGHFLFGHCRASLYNAMSVENTRKLAAFMIDFMQKNPKNV